jgi:L-fuculose-phosphate aldolase
MLLAEERGQVVEFCRRLGASGLSPGTSGNISMFSPASSLMAISPSSMAYDEIQADDVVLVDLDGRVHDSRRRPSTEHGMHLACYRTRPDIQAVVHTHSPRATTLAVLGWELPAVHYMIALAGSPVVRCAPYHLFGTPELAEVAVSYLGRGHACLLQNHGTLATGPDLHHAWDLTVQLEFCADLYLAAKAVGEPKILDDSQIAEVSERLLSYTRQRSVTG